MIQPPSSERTVSWRRTIEKRLIRRGKCLDLVDLHLPVKPSSHPSSRLNVGAQSLKGDPALRSPTHPAVLSGDQQKLR